MTIYQGSRYTNATGYTVPTNDGGVAVIIGDRKEMSVSKEYAQMYKVSQGQRLDQIAYEIYGNAQFKDYIMDANPQYPCELFIKPGDIITIPSLDDILGAMSNA